MCITKNLRNAWSEPATGCHRHPSGSHHSHHWRNYLEQWCTTCPLWSKGDMVGPRKCGLSHVLPCGRPQFQSRRCGVHPGESLNSIYLHRIHYPSEKQMYPIHPFFSFSIIFSFINVIILYLIRSKISIFYEFHNPILDFHFIILCTDLQFRLSEM